MQGMRIATQLMRATMTPEEVLKIALPLTLFVAICIILKR